jgi:signal transduction histidine kinase
MKRAFHHLTLAQQFLMVSFPVLLAGSLAIGWWIGKQVQEGVAHRIGSVTALYVDAFVGPHVQSLAQHASLTPADLAMLNSDLNETMLGQKIISLKVWDRSGRVLFSTDPAVIGKQFPIEEGLQVALDGNIFSEVSVRNADEQMEHGQPLPRLIETYTPIHEDRTGRVIAAAEFYERPDELDRLAGVAQRSSWLRVAAITMGMYLCLFLLVRRGSHTIAAQQSELSDKVAQLTTLNRQNTALQARVIDAAERATALNENFLQRVSADIHDGPGQDLGFALMQIKNMEDTVASTAPTERRHPPDWSKGLPQTKVAIESALKDLRAISADIELPDISRMELADIAARVVRDLQIKTGVAAELSTRGEPVPASFRIKVALYRLLQESLANTVRHAAGTPAQVLLETTPDTLQVEVRDHGPGFDPVLAAQKGRLGLGGMRQRVEVLGGVFDLQTAPGTGTLIRVSLPLCAEKPAHEQHD